MSKKTLYEEYVEDKEFERLMAQEDLIMDVTESFWALLEKDQVSKSALAKTMGKTKGYISQLLRGGRNLTLRSMADLAFSLGYRAHVTFTKKEAKRSTSSFAINWDTKKRFVLPVNELSSVADGYPECVPTIDKLAS